MTQTQWAKQVQPFQPPIPPARVLVKGKCPTIVAKKYLGLKSMGRGMTEYRKRSPEGIWVAVKVEKRGRENIWNVFLEPSTWIWAA